MKSKTQQKAEHIKEERLKKWRAKYNPLKRKFKTEEDEMRFCLNRMTGLVMLKTFPWRVWMTNYDIPYQGGKNG